MDEARLLPRYTAGPFLDRRHMERSQADALAGAVARSEHGRAPARFKSEAGDLRGIPVIGRGVRGVSPGSSPEGSISRLDRDLDRRHRAAALEPMVAFA